MSDFHLRRTLESGQLFRWRYDDAGALICHRDRLFYVDDDGRTDYAEAGYFFRDDQPKLIHEHQYVRRSLEAAKGLRIVRQDPWECLVTFIISQNNNLKRITKNIEALTRKYGKPISNGFYTFPLPEELGTEEELKQLGLGYRARYVAKLKDLDLDWLNNLKKLSYTEAKDRLMTLEGVGPKVADCVLLFSLGFDEAYPEDTWMKKVFKETSLTRESLGDKAGLYQQFLFHARRSSSRNRSEKQR